MDRKVQIATSKNIAIIICLLLITVVPGHVVFDDMDPSTGDTYDLGTEAAPWRVGYFTGIDVNDTVIRIRLPKTPTYYGDTGTHGQIAWDSSYIYVCVATNSWRRTSLAAWGFRLLPESGDTVLTESGERILLEGD